MKTLNEVYTSLSTRRRYEVWFLRFGLADGSGAWWFRYLLMNPGRGGRSDRDAASAKVSSGVSLLPVQIWATWFPREGRPQSFIQGFPLAGVDLSARQQNPFHFGIRGNEIGENSCRGNLSVDGHDISWDLRYRSTFHVTLSNKGWIGFSRTPHSDAVFSGYITLDGRRFDGDPLGFGVQGHNCGYRHRNFWTWTHIFLPSADDEATASKPTTLEALVYEMPFGMMFRKAVLWHEGEAYFFRNLRESRRDREGLSWNFSCASSSKEVMKLEAAIDGGGPSIHRLPYGKTDCSGSFEVINNSLAKAVLRLERSGSPAEILQTDTGTVLEMVGQ